MHVRRAVPLSASVLLACAVGCAPAPSPAPPAVSAAATDGHEHEHDHGHDAPATLAEGIARLESLSAELTEKLAGNSVEAADEAVHGIGHLLEELRDLAEKEGFAGETRAVVRRALNDLEECFGKVDEAFHAADTAADSPAKVLESVQEKLQAAFKAVKEVM
jgi:hypothetical protein